jgi:hypothetical protein
LLARRVVDLTRRGDDARQRDHIDHVAAAGGDHRLQGGDGAIHRPQHIDLEHRPAGRLVLLPGESGGEHAGVVNPEVESAGPRRRFRGERPAGGLVAHVEARRMSAGAKPGRRAGGRVGIKVGGVDEVAAVGELDGDRTAKATARSSNDGNWHRGAGYSYSLHMSQGRSARATIEVRAERLRGERKPLEESPDTTGHGGG